MAFVAGPISSSFVNRWGCRPVTIAGAILATVCMIISVYAQNVITLCITIGIGTGVGFGLIYLPAIVSVTTYFEKKRSMATGIAVCGSGLGTFIFAPFITILKEEYGWRGSLLIISSLVLNCVIFGAFFRPLEPEKLDDDKSAITLKASAAHSDIHISEHNLYKLDVKTNGDGSQIHRPRSMGHFSIPRGTRLEQNGNIPVIKQESDFARLALSQPMLTQSESNYYRNNSAKQHYGSQNFRRHGPIDRIDVFYQGSLMNIPSYRSRLDLKHGEDELFVQRRPSTYSYRRRAAVEEEDEPATTVCGFVPCSQETKDTLNEMLDFSLFQDVIFILFTVSNFLTSVGFNIPYVYIVPRAKVLGLTDNEGGALLSIIGAANTLGRIVLATALSAFCNSFYTLALYCSVFGFTIGAYVGLTSVILVDLLGLDKLTNAFGLLLLFQGIASLLGPPLAGNLFDYSNSYNPGFYLGGISIALSGVILFAIPWIQAEQKKHKQKQAIVNI
ncbi:unnamed protein product [Brassicogethes aeneus]|uniref:Major facilitator superfamily (MFS) profile domain-containing protein n=1 Tax=Brassicogethes aeneus TaxID=1431903 RepID=A0A9P0B6K4_BRAAE|nr:unnamed protein product [Brassicogethes aeneus]